MHFADCHRWETLQYQPGDRVWLSTKDIRNLKMLTAKFIRLFKIIQHVNDVSYKLDLPQQYCLSPMFHVSSLKPAIPGPLADNLTLTSPTTSLILEGQPAYTVHNILKSCHRRGTVEILVEWEDHRPEACSWVPSRDILNPLLIQNFHTTHPNKPVPCWMGRPRKRITPGVSA